MIEFSVHSHSSSESFRGALLSAFRGGAARDASLGAPRGRPHAVSGSEAGREVRRAFARLAKPRCVRRRLAAA